MLKMLAVLVMLFTFLAISFADAQELPRSQILLRVTHGSGWGSWGQFQRSLRVLTDGRVQCYHDERVGWNRADCDSVWGDDCRMLWRTQVDAELPPLDSEQLGKVNEEIAAIEGIAATDGIQCYDEMRRFFDTGHWQDGDFNFWTVSTSAECGQEGIDRPQTFRLTARLEALYAQCPLLPAEGDIDRERPDVPAARSQRRP